MAAKSAITPSIERKHAVEAEVLSSAVSCFEENGIRGTTIDQIADLSGVSRRTIYRYFSSKEGILRAAFEMISCNLAEELKSRLDTSKPFPEYVVDAIVFIIERAPHSPLYSVNTIEDMGASPLHFYFSSKTSVNTWLDLFQPLYIEALRAKTVDPNFDLEEIVEWIGRISSSFLLDPRKIRKEPNEIRASLELFFGKALRNV